MVELSLINLNKIASETKAVIIVALITGTISILGVIISSIVSRIVERNLNIKKYLFEKREDMGQRKRGLKKSDLLAFFINDIDKHLSN